MRHTANSHTHQRSDKSLTVTFALTRMKIFARYRKINVTICEFKIGFKCNGRGFRLRWIVFHALIFLSAMIWWSCSFFFGVMWFWFSPQLCAQLSYSKWTAMAMVSMSMMMIIIGKPTTGSSLLWNEVCSHKNTFTLINKTKLPFNQYYRRSNFFSLDCWFKPKPNYYWIMAQVAA